MVRQVFMKEKVDVGGSTRIRTGLAFGDHPDFDETDDREVTAAVARGNQQIRVVLDELVRGNAIEEIGCADGSFSKVPVGADPDDIAKCAGPQTAIADSCKGDLAVCICEDSNAPCAQDPGVGMPIGILDENEDGAADDFRMIEYDPGELAAVVTCDDTNIPLDREMSFYNPSGNQLIPAGPIGINGLGPALVLVPQDGLRTGAKCTITFQDAVVDKDGNQVCAPAGGDPDAGCNPGDTEKISWSVEPLTLSSSSPSDGASGVPLTASGSADATILLQFNAAIDADAAAGAITLNDGSNDVTVTVAVSADDPTILTVTVPGGFTADTDYTLTVDTGLTDIFGGALPEDVTITFSTGAAPPPDAAVPDAGIDAA